MFRPFTPEWAEAFREAINRNTEYRRAARGWVWPLTLVLEPSPELGVETATGIRLDLNRGECRGVAVAPAAELESPFRVTGPYQVWKSVVRGDEDPVSAIVRGRLRFRGSIARLMLHTKSARLLVGCAADVPTAFPDEESRTE